MAKFTVANTNVYSFNDNKIYAQTKEEVIDYLGDAFLFTDDAENNENLISLTAENKYIIVEDKHILSNNFEAKNVVVEDKHLKINAMFDTIDAAQEFIAKL